MLLASRKEPPKRLRVPQPTSRNSSTIREFLLHSPLPSPALPSILPRHGKKPPALNTRRILRYIVWLFILTTIYYIVQRCRSAETSQQGQNVYQHNGQDFEIVEDSQLPSWSSPLAVTDNGGQAKWTVHIPASKSFPLPSWEYADICSHIDEVAQHVASLQGNSQNLKSLSYYNSDPNYIDVAQAQLSDLIPFDSSFQPGGGVPVCPSSMTYVLDASDAGLGSSLLGLWLAYGLAQREKRAFFIDDSQFTYGRYSSLFEKPPTPNCRPAPPTHRVPCPHISQHLVVTPATWQWTFGKAFHEKFSEKDIFDMMRVGYESLFKLLPEDQMYVAEQVTQLRQQLGPDVPLAGMHIRRGDKHPDEFQYHAGYIPPTEYIAQLKQLLEDSLPPSSSNLASEKPQTQRFILASDDASIYSNRELKHLAIRAQDRILPSSNKHLKDHGVLGEERGFFKDAFWNLGLPDAARRSKHNLVDSPLPTKDPKYGQRTLNAGKGGSNHQSANEHNPHRNYKSNPTEEARQQRVRVGRAYLLDLAVLAQSDRLVCTVSSRGCRMLGVMMGWDKVYRGYWRNIDQGVSLGWRPEL